MWNIAIEMMISELVVMLLVVFSWILYPEWLRYALAKYRTASCTALWTGIFLLVLGAADHGLITGIVVASTTTTFVNLVLRQLNTSDYKVKDSVLPEEPKITNI